MGIRSKQMQTGTFGATTEGRAPFGASLFDNTLASSVFAAGAIPGSKLASGEVTGTQLATSVAGDGITGGGGSALAVQPNVTDGGAVPGVEVAANGLRLSAASAGAGLAGGAGTALSVGAGTGIVANANDMSLALATGTPTYSGTHVSTHTPDTLQVVGTPNTANDPVNKAALDAAIAGLVWAKPVAVREMIGSATIATINGLTPTAGDAYVVTDAGTPTAGSSDLMAIGSIAEYDGTEWREIVAGAGGFVATDIRALASTQTALNGTIGLTDGVDDGKYLIWDGTSLTPATETPPTDGNAVLVNGDGGFFENLQYVFQGTVPTGTWIQIGGASSTTAGAGMSAAGNVFNVGAANGITVNADDVGVDVDTETGGNIAPANLTANGVGLDVAGLAGTGIEADGSANLRLATQGIGISGGSGSTLSVNSDTTTGANIQPANVAANGVGVDIAAIAGTGIEADGSANLRVAAQGNGLTGGGGTTLAVDPLDASIAVAGGGISVNPSALVQGGVQQLDGDFVDIDYAPTNYSEETGTVGGVTSVLADMLTAHLGGIDTAIGNAAGSGSAPTTEDKNITASVTAADGAASGAAITSTPAGDGYVKVEINGIGYTVGDGVKTTECYFSSDGGTTARAISAITAADTLRWNGTIAGFELDATDRIDLYHNL